MFFYVIFSADIENHVRLLMTNKTENPIDSFVENSKKNRSRTVSDEDLKRINDLLDEANAEESELDDSMPLVAKSSETQVEPQV